MKSGSFIFLDLFLYFVVNGNFLAVNNFFYSLAVLVFASYLSGNFNGLEVIFLFYCQSDQTLSDLLYFFCSCLSGNDLAVDSAVTRLRSIAFL